MSKNGKQLRDILLELYGEQTIDAKIRKREEETIQKKKTKEISSLTDIPLDVLLHKVLRFDGTPQSYYTIAAASKDNYTALMDKKVIEQVHWFITKDPFIGSYDAILDKKTYALGLPTWITMWAQTITFDYVRNKDRKWAIAYIDVFSSLKTVNIKNPSFFEDFSFDTKESYGSYRSKLEELIVDVARYKNIPAEFIHIRRFPNLKKIDLNVSGSTIFLHVDGDKDVSELDEFKIKAQPLNIPWFNSDNTTKWIRDIKKVKKFEVVLNMELVVLLLKRNGYPLSYEGLLLYLADVEPDVGITITPTFESDTMTFRGFIPTKAKTDTLSVDNLLDGGVYDAKHLVILEPCYIDPKGQYSFLGLVTITATKKTYDQIRDSLVLNTQPKFIVAK